MKKKRKKRSDAGPETEIVGLRLLKDSAALFMREAEARGLLLNKLFMEIWELYWRERHRLRTAQQARGRKRAPQGTETKTIGLRLTKDTIALLKQEAAARGLLLNKFFMQMWELYQRERHRQPHTEQEH